MIETKKDLEWLVKLCRKQGVNELTLGAISLKMGDAPVRQSQAPELEEPADPETMYDGMPDRILTPEELTIMAQGGLPEDLKAELQ